MPEVKICGLTHPDDARSSAEAGASYVGVVFAGGPRVLDAERAREVLDAAGPDVRRVGVIGRQSLEEITGIAARAGLHILQLHADPGPGNVTEVRRATGCMVWAAVRVREGALPPGYDELAETADAIVLDSFSSDRLGGTGLALSWTPVALALAARHPPRCLVLAGGLRAGNVALAVEALRPDVLDVSSGVERVIGRKDPELLEAFARAARRSAA